MTEHLANAQSQRAGPVRWRRLIVLFAIMLAISFFLAYVFQYLSARLHLPLDRFALLTYAIVFLAQLISNLTIVAPVPIATSIMIAAATRWNPVLVALVGSIGGSLGELSGYYVGYLGKKTAINESTPGYNMVVRWMQRYGIWAISFLAFQPVLPFDIGGLAAGAARMPLHKFLPALWLGKFAKYVILCYSGIGLIKFLPFLHL